MQRQDHSSGERTRTHSILADVANGCGLLRIRTVSLFLLQLSLFPAASLGQQSVTPVQQQYMIEGHVLTADGKPVIEAEVSIGQVVVHTDQTGAFQVRVARGTYQLRVHTPQSAYRALPVTVDQDENLEINMPGNTSVIVKAGAASDIMTSDASTHAYDRKDLIAANPGRPGASHLRCRVFPRRPLRAGSTYHNTSRPAWLGTMASRLRNISTSADFFFRII